ncbi:hypothetical protein Gohar_005206 [Gossypium harknessii]|uniref:RNase H type-1 domain-containing protein n=1 Tax=Gossypium harknessii TaxID=34285 RepID=A0A7J9H8L3_9ROSI|nr:hypothetical protein [Gossypium harknessii]
MPHNVFAIIWVVFKGRLFMNVEKCMRGLSEDPSCKLCGNAKESCLHVIQDCPKVKEVWNQLIPSRILDRFFTYSLENWLSTNLVNKLDVTFQDVDWLSLFGIVCWKIWKQWNRQINSRGSIGTWIRNERWAPLPVSFFKINIDGTRNLNLGSAWSTTVARDEHDNWMWGIGRSIGRCSVLQVELWVIYDGLQLAWEAKWDNVIIETDSAQAIKGVHEEFIGHFTRDLIVQIQELCNTNG